MSNGDDEQDVKSNGGDLALNINIVKKIEKKNGIDGVEHSPWTLRDRYLIVIFLLMSKQ